MITANIAPTHVDANDEIPPVGSPLRQSETLCLKLRKTLENLETAGFEFQQTQMTDFVDVGNDVTAFLNNANTRFDQILQTGFSSVVANLPDVLSLMAAIGSGGTSEIPIIILNAMLGMMFHWRDSQIEAAQGEPSANSEEIVEKLAEISARLLDAEEGTLADGVVSVADSFVEQLGLLDAKLLAIQQEILLAAQRTETAIHTIMNEYTINLHSDKEDLTFKGGRGF